MNIPTSRFFVRLCSLAFATAMVACDASTTAPREPDELRPSASATSSLNEFPVNINFQAFSQCLNAPVTISGTAWFSVRTVVKPDGSRHLTILMDVSETTIRLGSTVWTAPANAAEMFVRNVPAGGIVGVDDQQSEHQGTIIYRSPDGHPDLRFVHRIHLVRLPDSDEVQLNHSIFAILCVGWNS